MRTSSDCAIAILLGPTWRSSAACTCRCRPRYQSRITFANVRAFLLSLLRQGILGESRISYWKFVAAAATRHPESFGAAMTKAVMGYHFQVMTKRVLAGSLNSLPI
jgi:hypothetical protein